MARPRGRNPKILLTVPQDLHDLLKQLSDLRGAPLATTVTEILKDIQPVLEALLPHYSKAKHLSDESQSHLDQVEESTKVLLGSVLTTLENTNVKND